MIILRDKTFSSPIPKSSNADKAYEKWKTSKDPKDAKAFMDIWTKEVYVPARQKGIMVDPDPAVVHAAGIR